MRKIFLFVLLLNAIVSPLRAQTFEEWFQQKKTQKKYLVQQIAALQVYIGYAKKGYKIAQEGLTTIGGFTRGELNLHTDFFNSLSTVHPEIRQSPKARAIVSLQRQIVREYNQTYPALRKSKAFTDGEMDYMEGVYRRLLEDCDRDLDELKDLVTDDKLQMKDDERLERIERLYLDMQDKYTFEKSFGNEALVLATARKQEQKDIQTGRALHGIKSE
ncbi:MAG: hypothetical protein SFW35_05060 [Chitinophagales bacterium]|nr:hypothetical protein [Chitinophagales bacterium]